MNSEDKPPVRARVSRFRNWISFVGMVVALGALFSFLLLFFFNAISKFSNPYVSILTYIVVPMFLIGGLVVMFGGALLEHRRRAHGGEPTSLKLDLNQPHDRRVMLTFVSGAVVFLLLSAIGCYQTFNFTESVTFCGEVCHKVMKPERVAHAHGPHARVACVQCHVGPGVSWFVKSKISGSYQLYAVAFNKFPRPIPTPIKNLRPARETCEQCHWPKAFVGNMDRTFHFFMEDASNSPYSIRLMLKVGGVDPRRGPVGGIHWHNLPGNKVEYIATDKARQVIPWVRVTDSSGKVTVFKTADFTNDPSKMNIRTMDCIDCHNRPAHNFLSPNQAVNQAMALGQIDPKIPWIKTNAVYVLTRKYKTEHQATNEIAALLTKKYPDNAKVKAAIPEVQRIYARNFFPFMKSNWSKYPNNIGHMIWPGCFRCHDGEHKTADKKQVIPDNCNTCHTILAQGTGKELKELTPGGQKFKHPGGDLYGYNTCTDCHTGGP